MYVDVNWQSLRGYLRMDRREFLERVVAAASITAASPLVSGAVRGVAGEDGDRGESQAGFPIPDQQTIFGLSPHHAELSAAFVNPPESAWPGGGLVGGALAG